jgi:tRNA-specific 2-thiouridylase
MRAERVIVGMSGGVDSAVAALLLQRAGCEVQGLFMSNWHEDDVHCTTAQDYQDARAVAAELGVVLHRVDFSAQYRERVFNLFLEEYRAGRTPNPDVLCNREIKFGLCLRYAQRLGAERFATGHYAQVRRLDDGPALFQAEDKSKDQSYFLHAVPRSQFERVCFPLGEWHKEQVRELARSAGLPVHAKPDSTGICFIGERPFAEFLGQYLPATPGPIETLDGRCLGQHRGLPYYTLGQRSGLTVGGARGYAAEPWYVCAKVAARNALIVVQQHQEWRLHSRRVLLGRLHWLCEPRREDFRAEIKLRYRQPAQPATVQLRADGGALLEFDQGQRAATPGQYAVLYEGERCLGGAVIEAVEPLAALSGEPSGAPVCAREPAPMSAIAAATQL